MGVPLHRCIWRVSQALSFVTIDRGDILTAKIHLFSSDRHHVCSSCPTGQGKVPRFYHLLGVTALVQVQCDDMGLVPAAASDSAWWPIASPAAEPPDQSLSRGASCRPCVHMTHAFQNLWDKILSPQSVRLSSLFTRLWPPRPAASYVAWGWMAVTFWDVAEGSEIKDTSSRGPVMHICVVWNHWACGWVITRCPSVCCLLRWFLPPTSLNLASWWVVRGQGSRHECVQGTRHGKCVGRRRGGLETWSQKPVWKMLPDRAASYREDG